MDKISEMMGQIAVLERMSRNFAPGSDEARALTAGVEALHSSVLKALKDERRCKLPAPSL